MAQEETGFRKPGKKTSEFWILVVVMVLRFTAEVIGNAYSFKYPDQDPLVLVSQNTWDWINGLALAYFGVRQGGKGLSDIAKKLLQVREDHKGAS